MVGFPVEFESSQMISYLMLGTNDLQRAGRYFDALLGEIGAKRAFDRETSLTWAFEGGGCFFEITQPFDGEPATVGNGSMVAFVLESQEQVRTMHAKALELGGTNEGDPGLRSHSFYGGYFRDLDGNKLCFFNNG